MVIKARNGMTTSQTQEVLDNQEQVLRNVAVFPASIIADMPICYIDKTR